MSKAQDISGTGLIHYTSRALRTELKSSNARILTSKARANGTLVPLQAAAMTADWHSLTLHPEIDEENTLSSGNPHYEDMRQALLSFEVVFHYEAPAKERAFFSALRTLLQESVQEPLQDVRDTKLMAAHRWFTKSRPRGGHDRDLAAALATSLSVVPLAPNASTQLGATMSVGAERMRPLTRDGLERHELRTAYSRESSPATGFRPLRPPPMPQSADAAGGAPPASAGSLALKATGTRSRGVAEGLPFVQYPSPPTGRTTRPTLAATQAAIAAATAARVRAAGLLPPSMLQDLDVESAGTAYAPPSKARSTELSHHSILDAPGGPLSPSGRGAGSRGGAPAPGGWVPTYRSDGSSASAPLGGYTGAPGGNRAALQRLTDNTRMAAGATLVEKGGITDAGEAEVEELRAKWRAVEASSGAADVADKVAKWSLQRARLEEEIVRRQEASAYASSALWRGKVGPPAPVNAEDDDDTWRSELSAYGNLGPVNGKPGAYPTPAAGAPLPTGLGERAHGARNAARADYEAEAGVIRSRMESLGVGVASAAVLERALAPVPDRAFVDCVQMLPRPGEHLVSRPGSVHGAVVGKKKKKKGKGKPGQRPTSGR